MQEMTIQVETQPGSTSKLHYYMWSPASPSAWLHIIHGMSEHALRYANLAEYLRDAGFLVTADDHRGHGKTGLNSGLLNHISDANGWQRMLEDQRQILHTVSNQSGLSPVIMGHSMGAMMALSLAQRTATQWHNNIRGLVLSAATCGPSLQFKLGAMIARFERARLGLRKPSKILQHLSFDSFNRAFNPNRTASDWLSRDTHEVDNYVADQLCGGPLSTQSWVDVLEAMAQIFRTKSLRGMQSDQPVYLMSGDQDPVGGRGKKVRSLYRRLSAAGLRELTLSLYPGARHEIFKEINRDEVYEHLLSWLESRFAKSP